MYEITTAKHTDFTIPTLDYRGAPLGIEVNLVIRTGVLPVLTSGIAHQKQGASARSGRGSSDRHWTDS